MIPPDDIPALLAWVKEQELNEHNLAAKYQGFTKGIEHEAAEKAFKAVADKIEHGRINQKGHIPNYLDQALNEGENVGVGHFFTLK